MTVPSTRGVCWVGDPDAIVVLIAKVRPLHFTNSLWDTTKATGLAVEPIHGELDQSNLELL